MCGKADHQNEIAVESTGCRVECNPERLDLFDSESLSPTHERLGSLLITAPLSNRASRMCWIEKPGGAVAKRS